jgi:DNA-binding NarL/FixJ family response regulator
VITLLLVDDQPTVLQGLRMRLSLEPDIQVVGGAENGAAAIAFARSVQPDVIVLDVERAGMDGFSVAAVLRAITPASVIIMLSLHDTARAYQQAQEVGAAAFVPKHAADGLLLDTIRRAAQAAKHHGS